MGKAEIIKKNEFKEIMNDFTHPLEFIRESIQNSLDANCKTISIDIKHEDTSIGKSLNIVIEDDGDGIPKDKICNFFDLGNSTKIGNPNCIGEKGHGTKIFYNSNKVTLESFTNFKKYKSVLNEPFSKIFKGEDLEYSDPILVENTEKKKNGVRITIEGYLKNTSSSPIESFSHPAIKDYILWFTGFGSIVNEFYSTTSNKEKKHLHNKKEAVLYLRSYDSELSNVQTDFKFKVDKDGFEKIEFGHVFPKKNITKVNELKQLAKKYSIRNWEELFCKKLYCEEISVDGLEKPLQILIWVEGDKFKRLNNSLIRERKSTQTRGFQYKVSDRYGFWACKNYIPIQKVDHWITGKGSYTKFHAFINYDDFSLTANRSSIENTRPEDLKKIKEQIDKIFEEVINDREYKMWKDIEESASQERSAEVEAKEFIKRIKECSKRKRMEIKNIVYFEPQYEGELARLFTSILHFFPDVTDLEILDYNTHKGIDFLARKKSDLSLSDDRTKGYIELKFDLEKNRFNHSFKNLILIVCYNSKGLKIGDIITDLNGQKLKVVKKDNAYFLQDYNNEVGHNIDIIIIKDFLESKGKKFI